MIAVCNQKGGVAKTTTAVNLAASLSAMGRSVVLLDLDPQGNATMGCGVDKRKLDYSMLDVCLNECLIKEAIVKTSYEKLSIVPANQDLTVAEVEMRELDQAPFILKKQLSQLEQSQETDVIIIDCPPALNILTVNAMSAAEYIIVPIQCEYYALEGLTALLDTVSDLQKSVNKKLKILGFLRTMFDGRSRLATQVSAELESYLKDKVFSTVIPRNIRLAEAPSHGMPACYYAKSSKGAIAYHKLAKEVLQRLQ
ncbi:MAG: ParA family protein [Gammaproteobacteria bacterium]|nr:ParA family protein [Gammaproteobacteria bacterium]